MGRRKKQIYQKTKDTPFHNKALDVQSINCSQANATGRNSKTVLEFLEKNYKEDASRDECLKLALRGLMEVVESKSKSIEVAGLCVLPCAFGCLATFFLFLQCKQILWIEKPKINKHQNQ